MTSDQKVELFADAITADAKRFQADTALPIAVRVLALDLELLLTKMKLAITTARIAKENLGA